MKLPDLSLSCNAVKPREKLRPVEKIPGYLLTHYTAILIALRWIWIFMYKMTFEELNGDYSQER